MLLAILYIFKQAAPPHRLLLLSWTWTGMHASYIRFPSMACVYVSMCMNACGGANIWFGLWAADPFAGVNMYMRACRHGQSTVVMTPVFRSISGFFSSSSFSFGDFEKQNRKCLPGEQLFCQLENK